MLKTIGFLPLLAGALAILTVQPAAAGLQSGDITFTERNLQTGAGTYTALDSFFSGRAFVGNVSDFTGGTLHDPNGDTHLLSPDPPPGFNNYYWQTSALAPGAADTIYSDGKYEFDLTGAAPDSVTTVKSGTHYSATVPLLTGATYAALGSLHAHTSFTFGFGSWTGTLDEADTFFQIYDYTLGTAVFDAGFLPSSTTSITAPGSVFQSGHDYTAELIFSNRALGIDGLGHGTEVDYDLRTLVPFSVAGVPEPAALALFGLSFGALLLRRRRG